METPLHIAIVAVITTCVCIAKASIAVLTAGPELWPN